VTTDAPTGTQGPQRTNSVRSRDSGTSTDHAVRSSCGIHARRAPRGSKADDVPLTATSTAGRPDSTARTASKLPCWGSAHDPWKLVAAACTSVIDTSKRARVRRMSGNVDS
jgi:hypothetical protein